MTLLPLPALNVTPSHLGENRTEYASEIHIVGWDGLGHGFELRYLRGFAEK